MTKAAVLEAVYLAPTVSAWGARDIVHRHILGRWNALPHGLDLGPVFAPFPFWVQSVTLRELTVLRANTNLYPSRPWNHLPRNAHGDMALFANTGGSTAAELN